MRELGCRLSCVLFTLLAGAGIASARQGIITGLAVSPATADAGTAVRATATGSPSACGAVHINWGDGTAITYATETFPVIQSHVYKGGGTFTVRAQGMGNCRGEATSRVVIKGPPAPPPPPAPRLTAVVLSPSSAAPRTPVTITLQGSGACSLTLDFGDGNNQEIRGSLPVTVRHTYALEGSYTIVAAPAAPCAERRSATLGVGPRQNPRITAIEIDSPPGSPASMRAITIAGSGRCAYELDFGDGNSETRNAALPDVVRHNYPAEGSYPVVATAAPPCSGTRRSTVVVGRNLRGSMSHVEARPAVARTGEAVTVTVAGTGTCRFVVDFDDGESRTLTESLPHRLTYRYAQPGAYVIVAWTHEPCSGQGDVMLRIERNGTR
jgi:hypothetical protein